MANETPPDLAERNAEIVRLRAHGATYKELARDFHVSTARISQILQKAGVQIKRYRRAHEGPSPAAEPSPPEEAS